MDSKKKKNSKPYNTELHIFSSFNEAAEFDAKYNAGIAGVDHLANLTQLIKRIYLNELSQENDMNIYFK